MEPREWIRRERQKKGWTQAALGSRLKPPVAHQQIQKWENSDNLELRTLRRIHDALPIPEVGLLIGGCTTLHRDCHFPGFLAGQENTLCLPGFY